jgi:NAD(P)-dependent dehydrogenase (short-subunit alcohol dehydrogenase family)
MSKLKDKIVLITGAGKGSGCILAQAFAEGGAMVAANDISPINVEAAFMASMSALDGFTRQAAREFSTYGIHVYSVEGIPEKIVEDVFALLDL